MQWLTDTGLGRMVFTMLVSMVPVVELRGVESAEEQAKKRRLLELLGG